MTNKTQSIHDVQAIPFWLSQLVAEQSNNSPQQLPAEHFKASGGNSDLCECTKCNPPLWLGVDSGNLYFLTELDEFLDYTALDDDENIANLLTSIETASVGPAALGERLLTRESQE